MKIHLGVNIQELWVARVGCGEERTASIEIQRNAVVTVQLNPTD
jgi:hypothetical protein